MKTIESRRFLVRDDGTGRGRESEVLISEFLSRDSIVILGDPGIGKTTLLKGLARDQYQKTRSFLANPCPPQSGVLFLDALDEYRNTAGDQDAIVDISRAIVAARKPHFRLSCRAADWFGSADKEVLCSASASGQIVVLELLPLNEKEIEELAAEFVPDSRQFLVEARSAGLDALLGNPQTLELIARSWQAPKRPRNKFEAYDLGIAQLLKETNETHILRGAQQSLTELREAAAAAASVMLLSNNEFLTRLEHSAREGAIFISEIPLDKRNHLDEALRRRVFTSGKEHQFEFTHRTIAEFLAAEDLAQRVFRGFPISRALALMCGDDGIPISSLRGLYAWLMCHLPSHSPAYVSRDPYAVVTYGDASILPPESQNALWNGLRDNPDPWFLSSDDRGASFRSLANKDTASSLSAILSDSSASSHLHVAALEAVAASDEELGLTDAIRRIVLRAEDNVWLRTAALRAFHHVVRADHASLQALERDLSTDVADGAAANVRLELLFLQLLAPELPERTISVLRHLIASDSRRSATGRLYTLSDNYPEPQIDTVLRAAGDLLTVDHKSSFEVTGFFERLLVKRLTCGIALDATAIAPALLAVRRNGHSEDRPLLRHLRETLKREPSLLDRLFDALENADRPNSLWVFAGFHLWHVMPSTVWSAPPHSFMLDKAAKEADPQRAADFFRLYVMWFPRTGADVASVNAGFSFLDQRPDVAKLLGSWNYCEIDNWRLEQYRRRTDDLKNKEDARTKIIEHLMARLNDIASGVAQNELLWAAKTFFVSHALSNGKTPTDRLYEYANQEIADAVVSGFVRYTEREDIPSADEVLECWARNSIPWRHSLLSLSVYYRTGTGLSIPTHALSACVAEIITGLSGDGIPDFRKNLYEWLKGVALTDSEMVKATLQSIWLSSRGSLYGFHELSADTSLSKFLADVATSVLRSARCDDHTARTLVPIAFAFEAKQTELIGLERLFDPCLELAQRAIWITALYLNDPERHAALWQQLDFESNDAMWEAIEFVGGRRAGLSRTMNPILRKNIIVTASRRFPPAKFQTDVSVGSRNPWDASTFITRQIDLLAADATSESIECLRALERDPAAAGYQNYIRHRLTEALRQRRERNFNTPSAIEVRQALANADPASLIDLLAYIEDHLHALSYELNRTQKELYRAYWNESGSKLLEPKREEVCSGLLAEDLQGRVRSHKLIVTVEHHMVKDKECDIVVLQGPTRLLPIEAKHHYHAKLWTAWQSQLQELYASDAGAQGNGIYLVFWSGIESGKAVPKPPQGIPTPSNPEELHCALSNMIPEPYRSKLKVVIVDISPPSGVKPIARP